MSSQNDILLYISKQARSGVKSGHKKWSDENLFLTSSDRQFFTRAMSELLLMMRFCLHFLANHGQIGQLSTPIGGRRRKQVHEFVNSGTGEREKFPNEASTSSTWKNFFLSWTFFIVSLIIIQTRALAASEVRGSIFSLETCAERGLTGKSSD